MRVRDPHGVLAIFQQCGALQQGHFKLTSGLHSPAFIQKSLVFQSPRHTEQICRLLAREILTAYGPVDAVVTVAVGGIIAGYETARALGCAAMYLERENQQLALRRGFTLSPGSRVVLVDDVVTTGLSLREAAQALREPPMSGVELVGAACVVDRSALQIKLPVPLLALASAEFPLYAADRLPPELAAVPATEPGSRRLS